jgi:uncharacterized oligopeptide transporter (OPT) family protein
VGYIIGPRIAGVIFAGGVFAWLVVMPAIKFFGAHVAGPLYPGTIPIADMTPGDLWGSYIKPMGAGAVAAAGLITLLKTLPTIVAALRAGAKDLARGAAGAAGQRRTDRDLNLKWALLGAGVLMLMMWIMLTFPGFFLMKPLEHAQTSGLNNIFASVLVVVFGFLFVTVSSRITGLIGTSSNPISGMAIATLMATCAMFLVMGWTGTAFAALAISIGGVVCIASANAGNTSQDLKTGFLVGATPAKQQLALIIGVVVSVAAIGYTLNGMTDALEEFQPASIAVDINHLPDGVSLLPKFSRPTVPLTSTDGKPLGKEQSVQGMVPLNALNSPTVPDGKYFYNPQSGRIEIQRVPGIGSRNATAPQARLMATVINGILTRKLPWGLILLGVFLVVGVEILGIRSLSFAVGFYIPISTTLAIFCGGLVRWLVERAAARAGEKADDSDVSPGSLYASGLIAAGGIVGLMGIGVKLMAMKKWIPDGVISVSKRIPFLADAQWLSVLMFAVLAFSLYHFARKPLGAGKK